MGNTSKTTLRDVERAARLKDIIDSEFDGVQARLAEKMGISYNQMCDILSHRDPMGNKMYTRMMEAGVDANFVFYGFATPEEKDIKDEFEINEKSLIRKDGELYFTLPQIASNLNAKKNSIIQLIRRNVREFIYDETPLVQDYYTTEGGKQYGYLLSEEQVYILCMMMTRNEKARRFRVAVARLLKQIRQRDYLPVYKVRDEFVPKEEYHKVQQELSIVTTRYIQAKDGISHYKRKRFLQLRRLGLNIKEAARVVRISYRSARKLDKADNLFWNDTALIKSEN